MARRRPVVVSLAARVLDYLDQLDAAARRGDQATYASASLALRTLLSDVLASGKLPDNGEPMR